jgi:hypothetical protein
MPCNATLGSQIDLLDIPSTPENNFRCQDLASRMYYILCMYVRGWYVVLPWREGCENVLEDGMLLKLTEKDEDAGAVVREDLGRWFVYVCCQAEAAYDMAAGWYYEFDWR